jgi:hypothetical protein
MSTQVESKVQLGTMIKESNSVWLEQHKAEMRKAGQRKTIGQIVDEAIERMRAAEGGQIKLGF